MQSILKASQVVKKYQNKEVLHNVSITIEEGHIYGLLGRNGAGKTTLLSILTAQIPHNSGEVTLNDMTVWENKKALDYLCFSRELSATLMYGQNTIKVKEYFRAAAIFYPAWDKNYAEKLCALFGLDKNKKICKLSKGMMSMVTIIIALASKAPITLLDEPVAGLDIVAREMFYELLLKEHIETKRTFVVSTHIIEEAAKALEKVIVIDEGNIIVNEDVQTLIEQFSTISGKEDVVDEATSGLNVIRQESFGRSKMVCVRNSASQVEAACEGKDLDIAEVPLQKVFVYLTSSTEEMKL